MSAQTATVRIVSPTPQADRRLTLEEVLRDLAQDRLVAEEDAAAMLAARHLRKGDTHPLALIADQKLKDPRHPRRLLTLESLTEWLAGKVGLPYLHIDPFKIDFAAVTKVMSNAYATRFRILPIEVTGKDAVIATCEPYVREWEGELAQILRLQIRRVLANPVDIGTYQVEFYNLARSIKDASQQNIAGLSDIANFEQLVELGRSGKLDANDRHIVHIVDWLLQYAFQQRASDIHLEPRRDSGNVRFRIDGVLHQVYQIPTPVMAAMMSRVKILGRMDVVEKRRPQDGRIKTRTPDGDEVELRVSTMPTAFGEKLVMRVFNPEVLVKDFRELGFSDEDKERWNQLDLAPARHPAGDRPDRVRQDHHAVLHPQAARFAGRERVHDRGSDRDGRAAVQPDAGAAGHRPGLRLGRAHVDAPGPRHRHGRRDPRPGDRRHGDPGRAHRAPGALDAAHQRRAFGASRGRWTSASSRILLHSTILGVLAQRLVRVLCQHCRESAPIDEDAWQSLIRPWRMPLPQGTHAARGCLECRMTGYSGRIGIYEMMTMTPALQRLIQAETDLAALRQQAIRDGMRALRVSGALKVAAGITTVEEVLKVAPPAASERQSA